MMETKKRRMSGERKSGSKAIAHWNRSEGSESRVSEQAVQNSTRDSREHADLNF